MNERKHIIVYGASKQGKTSLINKNLEERAFVRLLCGPTSTRETLYNTLLAEVGAKIVESETKGFSYGVQVDVEGRIGGVLGKLTGVEGSLVAAGNGGKEHEATIKTMPIDLSNVQDVHRVLSSVGANDRLVLLENFHYLSEEAQNELAFDLRLWNDLNTTFVIIGIWKDTNYLQAKNPELADRVVEIPVEPWTHEQFGQIVATGAPHLNVEIPESIVSEFSKAANGSVGVFQELVKLYCRKCGATETVPRAKRTINRPDFIPEALAEKAREYESTYVQQLSLFSRSDKPGRVNPLYLKYYLTRFILDADIDKLQRGVRKEDLIDYTEQNLHRTVDRNVLVNQYAALLPKLTKAQLDIGMRPIVQYTGLVFKAIDPIFAFYMRHADRSVATGTLVFPGHLEEDP